jgi:mono/diheme cytochrome c family protein
MSLAFLVPLALFAAEPTGDTAKPALDRDAAARGAVTFRIYCGSCHGKTGHGDGKLAESLRRPPADLTRLAAKDGGVFDAEKVRQAIDGRETVAAHGESDMPVWGMTFDQPERDGEEEQAEIRAKLDDLVAFLQTLQAAKGETPKR